MEAEGFSYPLNLGYEYGLEGKRRGGMIVCFSLDLALKGVRTFFAAIHAALMYFGFIFRV
jgi:hypothetical protein